MDRLFNKARLYNEHDYVEYANMSLITATSALLYISHGTVFFLYTYNHFLIVTQVLGILISLGAFIINRVYGPRAATYVMIILICTSINIWTYCVDVGNDMRWYAILALCPLYFFPVLKKNDKIFLTVFITFTFISSTMLSNYHEPLMRMPNAALYNTISSFVVALSIAVELIIYRYFNNVRDNELKRIGTILDNIECGIVIVDAQTHELLDINPVAERMYAGDKNTVIGKRCHKFICPAEKGSCPITDLHQEVNRSERMLIRADGTTLPIIKSVAKIWYNEKPALLESFTDITNLKKAEEKLRLLEIAEQSNRAKSEFLSRMSHEMRTPMNAIIGMSKIAANTDDINRLRYCLAAIEASSTHLLGIINDILDMSKIESGKFELDSKPIHIEKILMKICDFIIELADQKNIKLDIFLDNKINTQYLGDELRLTQVIINLISNAVKFTHEDGAISLTADMVQKDTNSSVLRFIVADTGIGMTEEQISRLFNAFEQADGSITRRYGGTGLGLAISKNIVEKMDGKIWVESKPDRGSTFTFEVRLEHTAAQPETETAVSDETRFPNIKVLVMDTDAETRAYFISIVKRHGIIADEAENIESLTSYLALAKETGEPYDALFLAYYQRGTYNLESLNKLTYETDRSTVILMTSMRTWRNIEDAANNAGFNKYISKPLFPSAVLGAINSIAEAPAMTLEAEATPAKTIPDFSGVTLLLAEDVPINQEIFIALLEETKIRIDVVENGMEAVQKFKDYSDRYDAIIMDIQMPVMNGYEATEIIRAMDLDKAKSIPIIALTADAFKEDINKCLACGMNDHLKKPIEIEVVFEKLAHYCGQKDEAVL